MSGRFSMAQVLKALKAGPSTGVVPSAEQVIATAAQHPKQFSVVLSKLFYSMVDEQFRRPRADAVSRYANFSREWNGKLEDDSSRFYLASLEAYRSALDAGFRDLNWSTTDRARKVSEAISHRMPSVETVEGLAWRCLLGQAQSIYSRTEAAASFSEVRGHHKAKLASEFTRNVGAFTYFSESEVHHRRRDLPKLSELQVWRSTQQAGSDQAILIAVDVHFFRVYAPMILLNAQQLPNIDFVFLISAPADESQHLYRQTEQFLSALSLLNNQGAGKNVRFISIQTPAWVENERTFYACSRFVALPDLLNDYRNVYVMDADLFMIQNPENFMRKMSSTKFGVTRTDGLHGVPPWRRYMAGNVVVNQEAKNSDELRKVHEYLSVGLTQQNSWTLDQNALCYSLEQVPGGYSPVTTPRPTLVGSFLGDWERNYKASK